jgi:hypothetical protein
MKRVGPELWGLADIYAHRGFMDASSVAGATYRLAPGERRSVVPYAPGASPFAGRGYG